jgi:transcriptional regulator with XRE-family HTH domain
MIMMSDFATTLRALMEQRGTSQRALAGRVYCDRALIWRYSHGKQLPSPKLAQKLDEVLGAGGALVALAEKARLSRRIVLAGGLLGGSLLSLTPETLERLAWADRHSPRIDAAVVESLADVLAAQRRAEDTLGSAAMLRPALAQLTVIEDLVKHVHGSLRPALVDVAQQWAQFAGWLCRDAGDLAGARACCALALEWAAELGDRSMTATVLVERSYMAAEAGEAGSMIGLAQGAQRDTTAATGQRALAAGLEARGYAMVGDSAAAERKLGDAQDLAAALAGQPQDQRPWSYWMTPAFFQDEEGITCAFLAGTGSRWHDRAVDLLAARPQATEMALWARAANLTHLAFAHAQAGDVDQACAAAVEASGATRRTGSARHAAMLSRIRAGLQAQWPGDTRVAELADALR